ncbi:MAG: hypothetical protein ABJA93_09185 [Sporichthyaceae bacterium]
MKKLLPAVTILLLALALVAGCGDGYGNSPGKNPSGTESTNGGGY